MIVRLVWVIIPLVLFSIVGIQESFAEQASGKPAWETNSNKVCGDRLCSEIEEYENSVTQESFGEEYAVDVKRSKIPNLDEEVEYTILVNGSSAPQASFRIFLPEGFELVKPRGTYDGLSTMHGIIYKNLNVETGMFIEMTKFTFTVKPTKEGNWLIYVGYGNDLSRDYISVSKQGSYLLDESPPSFSKEEVVHDGQTILLPPSKQIQLNFQPQDIVCKEHLEKIYKSDNMKPACVKSSSILKLIERGWFLSETQSKPGDLKCNLDTNIYYPDKFADGLLTQVNEVIEAGGKGSFYPVTLKIPPNLEKEIMFTYLLEICHNAKVEHKTPFGYYRYGHDNFKSILIPIEEFPKLSYYDDIESISYSDIIIYLNEFEGKTWMEYDLNRCWQNPWEKDWIEKHSQENFPYNSDEYGISELPNKMVKSYFQEHDIKIHDVKFREHPYGDGGCMTGVCSCPNGYVLYVLVDSENVDKLKDSFFREFVHSYLGTQQSIT